MLIQVLQWDEWDHQPRKQSETFRVRKGRLTAECERWSHPLGWELRLFTSDLLQSQVCRTSDEILNVQEQWRIAMIGKGWA